MNRWGGGREGGKGCIVRRPAVEEDGREERDGQDR